MVNMQVKGWVGGSLSFVCLHGFPEQNIISCPELCKIPKIPQKFWSYIINARILI